MEKAGKFACLFTKSKKSNGKSEHRKVDSVSQLKYPTDF